MPRPTDEAPPRLLWLYLPPLFLLGNLGWRLLDEPSYRRIYDNELGPEENLTVLALLAAVALGVLALRRMRGRAPPLALAWVAALSLGCFYFGGEEASWGQHWFGWSTPEELARLNDQGETNLHNVSSWLDQKPRLALELWTLAGGVLGALGLGRRLGLAGGVWDWVWPPREVLPTAVMALAIGWTERLKDLLGLADTPPIDVRLSETQELFFAWFLMLSLLAIRRRAAGAPFDSQSA